MGRIVVNKHFDTKAQITPDSFAHKGELIISNQVGYEGICIINKAGDMFFIAPTSGTGADVPTEYKEYIESFVNGSLENYLTSGETMALIASGKVNEEQIKTIVNGEIESALTIYSTTDEVNSAITQAVSSIEIPSLDGYATETWVTGYVVSAVTDGQVNLDGYATEDWVNNQGFLSEHQDISGKQDTIEDLDTIREGAAKGATALQEIPTEEIRQVAAEEIVKIVNSADSRYDTLKEISDWILNDTTGAAAMANDITHLKSISADTRIAVVESGLTTVLTKISGLTTEDIYDEDNEKTQAEINRLVLQGGTEAAKHFFMTTDEYATLITDGKVTIDGTEIVYDENAYYALYESEE